MLVVDDKLLNLARMQEALLKRTTNDRHENLEKYKKTVTGIDTAAFACMLEELKKVNEHNQTLEEELQFLEQIKDSYNQLLELQLGFKRVCELCGEPYLPLSDLSQINIQYVEERINTINGYLINSKNIDYNKKRLEELNERLFAEEKKKKYLLNKIDGIERKLKDILIVAQGRIIVNGQMVPTSVIDEYKKVGIDFVKLLDDKEELGRLLKNANNEEMETAEKLTAAKICYNNVQSDDSKEILDGIHLENLNARYKLILLRIVELLSYKSDSYDSFNNKINQLQELISERVSCLTEMGMKVAFDSFKINAIFEQVKLISPLANPSESINQIKREIAQLSERVEEMISQNNSYMVEINHTEDLVLESVITQKTGAWDENSYFLEQHAALDNQVIHVRDIPKEFHFNRAVQKMKLVLTRVNDMTEKKEPVENDSLAYDPPALEVIPELVLVDDEKIADEENASIAPIDDTVEIVPAVDSVDENSKLDIFETVVPFEETSMFLDRTDGDVALETENKDHLDMDTSNDLEEKSETISEANDFDEPVMAMPDVFWTMQDDSSELEKTEAEELDLLKFAPQDTKRKKLGKENSKKVA